MKRRWFLLCGLTAAILSAAACQPEEDESEEDTFQEFTEQKSAEKSTEEEPYAFYLFSEELAMTVDGRSFLAEDAPENAAEEAPVNYGNGSHSRYYVCGRTEEDPVWRIYEWGFM